MAQELQQILDGLESIRTDIHDNKFQWSVSLEDVHMNVEAALTSLIGDVGKKLHTGRSRNDQIATDLRLYVRDEIDQVANAVSEELERKQPVVEQEAKATTTDSSVESSADGKP